MKPNAPNELNLVNSARLRAIRDQQSQNTVQAAKAVARQPENSDLRIAQALIDSALHELLSQLPEGKQRSLFKIRFGVDPAELKQGSILEALKLLKLSQQSLTNPQALAELNYNGDRI